MTDVSTTCAVVIFRVKANCITSVDGQVYMVYWRGIHSLRNKRFRASSSRNVGTRAKKREWQGRGRGKKETLARKPHDFEKLRSPTNAASDWCGTCSVDYLALETSIKPGMLCLQASQIWSHLICGRRLQMLWTWIVFVQRFMRSESSKSIWKSSSGD